jgi:hypothetical protein
MISGVAVDFRTRNLENTSLVHNARHPASWLSGGGGVVNDRANVWVDMWSKGAFYVGCIVYVAYATKPELLPHHAQERYSQMGL